MGDCIEGSQEVQLHEGCCFALVEEGVDVVGGGKVFGLGAVVASEAGLGDVQDMIPCDEL